MTTFLDTCRQNGVWLILALLCVVLAVGAPYLRGAAVANCKAINENRAQGNVRAHVLRAFINDAARAREDAAVREEVSNPRQARADHATAQRYLALRAQVRVLSSRSCP